MNEKSAIGPYFTSSQTLSDTISTLVSEKQKQFVLG